MTYHLGVDLGTTFVAAALSVDSKAEMFTLGDRSVVTPAVVYLREDGQMVTGEAANRRASSSPERVGREFKRRLGDPTPVMLGGTPHSATDLLGVLLRDVLLKVTETEGVPPQAVVLTHPANWGGFRRGLFEEVPRLAGLVETVTITEPEAAAAHYAATRDLDTGETVAVYDLGGGTFDVTVLRKSPGGVEIVGTPEGIERLGGIDFDDALLKHIDHVSGGAISELDPRESRSIVALARLRQDCVLAKESLSIDRETVIPVFLPGRNFDVTITRTDFENLVRAYVESTVGALSRALRSAQISPGELSAVLLVGGSSRIPLVSEMVSDELGRPTLVDTHPKYAVALGAATVAHERLGSGTSRHAPPPARPPAPAAAPSAAAAAPSTPQAAPAAPVAAPSVLAPSILAPAPSAAAAAPSMPLAAPSAPVHPAPVPSPLALTPHDLSPSPALPAPPPAPQANPHIPTGESVPGPPAPPSWPPQPTDPTSSVTRTRIVAAVALAGIAMGVGLVSGGIWSSKPATSTAPPATSSAPTATPTPATPTPVTPAPVAQVPLVSLTGDQACTVLTDTQLRELGLVPPGPASSSGTCGWKYSDGDSLSVSLTMSYLYDPQGDIRAAFTKHEAFTDFDIDGHAAAHYIVRTSDPQHFLCYADVAIGGGSFQVTTANSVTRADPTQTCGRAVAAAEAIVARIAVPPAPLTKVPLTSLAGAQTCTVITDAQLRELELGPPTGLPADTVGGLSFCSWQYSDGDSLSIQLLPTADTYSPTGVMRQALSGKEGFVEFEIDGNAAAHYVTRTSNSPQLSCMVMVAVGTGSFQLMADNKATQSDSSRVCARADAAAEAIVARIAVG